MPEHNPNNPPPRRSGGARAALIVSAALAALVAVSAMGVGALALWGEDQKDESGYVSTDSHRFGAGTHALATENMDVDLDGVEGLVDSTSLGDVRLKVAPRSGKPVFVGIARTDDVRSYLRGVAHTTLTDVDYDPFGASYSPHGGKHAPAPPAESRIWAASTQGSGTQKLTWDAEDGDWSVVVMNADGSSGVQADISAGAKLPFLTEIGWSALGGGAILLVAAAALAVMGTRPPSNRPRTAPAGAVAPAAG